MVTNALGQQYSFVTSEGACNGSAAVSACEESVRVLGGIVAVIVAGAGISASEAGSPRHVQASVRVRLAALWHVLASVPVRRAVRQAWHGLVTRTAPVLVSSVRSLLVG
jgi:hypothetical protein